MKIIETLYDFTKQLGYSVQWTDVTNSFSEVVLENNTRAEILYQQDGNRLIITAPKISLSDIDEAEKAKISSNALAMNINQSSVFYGLIDETIYARANIVINDDIDDVITQFIQTRQHILNSVISNDLLSIPG